MHKHDFKIIIFRKDTPKFSNKKQQSFVYENKVNQIKKKRKKQENKKEFMRRSMSGKRKS